MTVMTNINFAPMNDNYFRDNLILAVFNKSSSYIPDASPLLLLYPLGLLYTRCCVRYTFAFFHALYAMISPISNGHER